jgi:hypothetical protein
LAGVRSGTVFQCPLPLPATAHFTQPNLHQVKYMPAGIFSQQAGTDKR